MENVWTWEEADIRCARAKSPPRAESNVDTVIKAVLSLLFLFEQFVFTFCVVLPRTEINTEICIESNIWTAAAIRKGGGSEKQDSHFWEHVAVNLVTVPGSEGLQ